MKKTKKHLLRILLITSMLFIQLRQTTINVIAAEAEAKTINTFSVTLKPGKDDQPKNIFYLADEALAKDDTLDEDDLIFTVKYSDDTTETINPSNKDYTITTNIDKIRINPGADQELNAALTYKDDEGKEISVTSTDNPTVTILPAPETKPSKIELKLKDKNRTTFYVANGTLNENDTLDIEDLEIDVTFKTKTPKKDYFKIDKEADKYEITNKTETLSLPLEDEKRFNLLTNIDEVRSNVKNDQILKAELTYTESVFNEDDITKTNYTTIDSSNNPKVNIIEPNIKSQLSGIKLKLKDNDKKFYADNGLMAKKILLSEGDIDLIGIYSIGYSTDSTDYDPFKTEEKSLPISSPDYKLKTNIDAVKKLVGQNEITASLTYKDENNKEISIETIDNETANKAKEEYPKSKITATTAEVTILPPLPIDGIVTVTPQNFGADETDIKTDKPAIQDALNLASDDYRLLIKFPAGNYYTGGNLYVHSNTTLKLDDKATIIRNSNADPGVPSGTTGRLGVDKNMFKVSPYNSTAANLKGGYDNGSNITFEGGTFDGGKISASTDPTNLINLGHASNITIKNATFKNCYGNHLIELVAVQNAEISGCTFTGFRYITEDVINSKGQTVNFADPKGNLAEAIQIDVAHKDWTSTYLTDDTPCNNINIHDNIIKDYPVGIGNHHSLGDHHHNNVTITNNIITSKKTKNSGIKLYGCDNSTVTSNSITNCSNGIITSASANFIISNNSIDSSSNGIKEIGSASGRIISNIINNPANHGISIYGSGTYASTINQNTVINSGKNGILVYSGALCEELVNNDISNCSSKGIKVYEKGKVSYLASNNITSCMSGGIEVYDSGSVSQLKYNAITSCKSNGIEVYSSASVPQLKNNTIASCQANGIKVYGSASIPQLEKNSITFCQKNGIEIYGSASVPKLISNSISNCNDTGIYLHSSASSKTIKSNKITDCNKYGVYVCGKASVKTISANTITNVKNNGIYINNSKNKITLKSNRLTSVASSAIKINSKFSKKKKQKYTFAPKVISLNLEGGVMKTQASKLKKIKLKVGDKSYTKSTKKKKYTFKFKKYGIGSNTATVTFTDKNQNTVTRVLDLD